MGYFVLRGITVVILLVESVEVSIRVLMQLSLTASTMVKYMADLISEALSVRVGGMEMMEVR